MLDGGGDHVRAAARAARTTPSTARLSASVPPPVKTISPGWQWIERRHLPPRRLQPLLGFLAEMVNAGSVTIHLTETRRHGLQHFGSQGSGGVVVEVNVLHLISV